MLSICRRVPSDADETDNLSRKQDYLDIKAKDTARTALVRVSRDRLLQNARRTARDDGAVGAPVRGQLSINRACGPAALVRSQWVAKSL